MHASSDWSARIIALCNLEAASPRNHSVLPGTGPVAAVLLFMRVVALCDSVGSSGTRHLSCRRMRGGVSVEGVREARRALCRKGKAQRMPEGRVLVEIVAEVPAKPAAKDQTSSFICKWQVWLLVMLPSTFSIVQYMQLRYRPCSALEIANYSFYRTLVISYPVTLQIGK